MKKPFSFDKRSTTVFCSNPKCAQVRGAEGVSRAAIKENVVARQSEDKPLMCYDCNIFFKTGKNRHQRKADATRRKMDRVQAAQEAELKSMAANA